MSFSINRLDFIVVGILQRQAMAQANQAQRLVKSNELAKRAAALLKETFQARQVAVFGSPEEMIGKIEFL